LAYEVRQNRYPITPSDALLLGAMELYQKHNRYSAGNPETVKEKLEKLVEHLIPSKLVNGSFQEIR
jgi:hypothetical protein